MRVGTGFDTHRLAAGRKLILGGCEIPYDKGLLGHSDADVLIHAIINALLGAMGKGDIGRHFPDTDDTYRDISGLDLLASAAALLRAEGCAVVNIDTTVLAHKPRLAPYTDTMRVHIANCLAITPDRVNIKATTEEGLGHIGAGEGISAQAVCLITSI